MFKKRVIIISLASAFSVAALAEDNRIISKINNNNRNEYNKVDAIFNEYGDQEFIIRFKSLETVTNIPYGQLSGRNSHSKLAEISGMLGKPEQISNELLRNNENINLWADNDSIASIVYLKENYKIDAEIVTTIISKEVRAFLSKEQIELLDNDETIESVRPNLKLSLSSWSDTIPASGQVTPWGIYATNSASMNNSSVGFAYMVDTPLPTNISLTDHPNITRINVSTTTPQSHGVYTSAIIGATNNSIGSRGIFSGNLIYSYLNSNSEASMMSGVEHAFAHAENNNKFAALNLSINPNNNELLTHDKDFHRVVSIASNRLLVVESAGNGYVDACTVSFNPQSGYGGKSNIASPIDGIMVVGGYDKYGQIATNWPDKWSRPANQNGSNSGACIDIWGPAKNILVSTYPDSSPWKNTSETTQGAFTYYPYSTVSSGRNYIDAAGGTSFAAPFVTGIASAYSNNNTLRPPQLESMIRATAQSTGYNDNLGFPIRSVYYNSQASMLGAKYVTPIINNAFGNQAGLTDGKTDFAWNAGSNQGSIEFTVPGGAKFIRFTPRGPEAGADGELVYSVQSQNPINNAWFTIASGSTFTHDRVPVSVSLPGNYAALKLVLSKPNGHWVALGELEAYQ